MTLIIIIWNSCFIFYAYHHRLPAAFISSTIIVTRHQAVIPFAAEKIRVGRDYQAVCPELEPVDQRRPELISDRALLVWSPTCDISDMKCKWKPVFFKYSGFIFAICIFQYLCIFLVDEYITTAKEKYGYNGEQALGMLFWHKHDLNRASMDLANFTPFPDEWTVEDKVLFEQAFQFHGKSFHRIRQMVRFWNIICSFLIFQ